MASVTLVSHASVVIEAAGVRILTDPWLFGKAFNDGWALIAEAAAIDFDEIDYLWISHEHPDHFHLPSLRSLSEAFRQRVTVLFQQSGDHHKMVAALRWLGFVDIHLLPNKTWLRFGPIELLCYQSRHIDSALAVRTTDGVLLNINDCDLDARDLAVLRRLAGSPDILLNQFSLAGFLGIEADLARDAARILDDMVTAHRALGARITTPFASFHYFCCADNARVNAYANSPAKVAERFADEGLQAVILTPGETYGGGAHDNRRALDWWRAAYASVPPCPPDDEADDVPPEAIAEASRRAAARLRSRHGLWARLLRPLIVDAGDLGRLAIDLATAPARPATNPHTSASRPSPCSTCSATISGSRR